MDAVARFALCFGSCGAHAVDDPDVPRWWTQQQQQQQQQHNQVHGTHGPGGAMYRDTDTDSPPGYGSLHEKSPAAHPYYRNASRSSDMDNYKNASDAADYVLQVLLQAHAGGLPVQDQLADVQRLMAGDDAGMALSSTPVWATAAWKTALSQRVFERLVAHFERVDLTGPQGSAPDDTKNPVSRIVAFVRTEAAGVFQWAADHPDLVRLLACVAATAVLWALVPVVLTALGFGAEGPIAGSVAARLMTRYLGHVPKGSWYGFLQRLGATWHRW